MIRIVVLLLVLALPAAAQTAAGTGAVAELRFPAGAGPHPAVVLLHGCSGITPTVRRWAARFAEWGYVALVADSFGPRGVTNVCRARGEALPAPGMPNPSALSSAARLGDAFAAAATLRARADVRPDRVFLVGFSHGAGTALMAATRPVVERRGATPFRGVVAFYPWCPLAGAPLASPLLTLIGDADDWTPAERCRALWASRARDPVEATLHVYPSATHAFDAPAPARGYLGHQLRHDPVATEDAVGRVRAFLARE